MTFFCNCIFVCIFVCILFLFLFSDLSTESVATGISTLGLYLCFCYLYYALPVVCTSRYILLAKRSINITRYILLAKRSINISVPPRPAPHQYASDKGFIPSHNMKGCFDSNLLKKYLPQDNQNNQQCPPSLGSFNTSWQQPRKGYFSCSPKFPAALRMSPAASRPTILST
jgi:hypothetical protein